MKWRPELAVREMEGDPKTGITFADGAMMRTDAKKSR